MMPRGIPQESSARAAGVPSRERSMSDAEIGTAANDPMPVASIRRPTPALPACRSRRAAMTARAIHIPRTNVRSPLTTRRPPTWGSRTTASMPRTRSRNRLESTVWPVGIGVCAKRIVRSAAARSSAAAAANAVAGDATTSRKPPPMAPRAWLSVFTVLTPAADAASSRRRPRQEREHRRLGRSIGGGDDGVDGHQDEEHGQRGPGGGQGGARRHEGGAGAGHRREHA